MRCEWLIREGRARLVLFFAGWGMDARPFRGIDALSADVLVLFSYHEEPDGESLLDICADYACCDVLAWSLGVVMAAQWCAARDVPVTHAVALNGTPFPVHDDQGIPRDWIAGTLARLSDADLQQFYRLMCGGPKVLKRFLAQAPVRNVDDLRRELVFLKDQPAGPTSVFGHALISTRDRIVPTANQQHCWRAAGVACRDIKGPHFPFYSVAHWEALLDA